MPSSKSSSPEHWEADAGEVGVARLDIPPDSSKERRFEIFCNLSVARTRDGDGAWQQMRVLVNGSQEWLRREPVHDGGRDSLDYRFRRVVPVGEPLRVKVSAEFRGARRLGLRITADED